MTLIIEDGTGLSNAESYISVADATTYHANRGNSAWASIATDLIREQLLRKATDYMVSVYRQRWRGYRKTATQALDFPRSFCYLEPFVYGAVGAYPYLLSDTIVPNEVKNACAELALKALTVELMPDQTQTVIREKVDVIEVEYDANSPAQTRYAQIDALLSVYFTTANSFQARIVRK